MALQQGKCHGSVFVPGRVLTPGDVLSLTIFNLVIDAVCREVEKYAEEKWGTVMRDEILSVYYEDRGYIGNWRPEVTQAVTDKMVELFYQLVLKANVGKTKGMVS